MVGNVILRTGADSGLFKRGDVDGALAFAGDPVAVHGAPGQVVLVSACGVEGADVGSGGEAAGLPAFGWLGAEETEVGPHPTGVSGGEGVVIDGDVGVVAGRNLAVQLLPGFL